MALGWGQLSSSTQVMWWDSAEGMKTDFSLFHALRDVIGADAAYRLATFDKWNADASALREYAHELAMALIEAKKTLIEAKKIR